MALVFTATLLLGFGFWLPARAELAQFLLDRAWRSERLGGDDARPWPWADTTPFARLAVPVLGASWIVVSGTAGHRQPLAPTYLDDSAAPGEPGVTVITGHCDKQFRALERIEAGTGILLERQDGNRLVFIVDRIEIVDSGMSRPLPDATVPTLMLTTCYPFDAHSPAKGQRLIISGEAVI